MNSALRTVLFYPSRTAPSTYYAIYNWSKIKKTTYPDDFVIFGEFEVNPRLIENDVCMQELLDDVDAGAQAQVRNVYYCDYMCGPDELQ